MLRTRINLLSLNSGSGFERCRNGDVSTGGPDANGDTFYAEICALYAEELAEIPTPTGLTPTDLAIILAVRELERLTADATTNNVRVHLDLDWKHALCLRMNHSGYTNNIFVSPPHNTPHMLS